MRCKIHALGTDCNQRRHYGSAFVSAVSDSGTGGNFNCPFVSADFIKKVRGSIFMRIIVWKMPRFLAGLTKAILKM